MMFKRWKKTVLVFFLCLMTGVFCYEEQVNAEEQTLPEGEILLIYSDGASNGQMSSVMSIVESLTCQSFQVTYAPASNCLGELERFNSIICYDVTRYPTELIAEVYEREQAGNAILRQRENDKNSSGINDIRLLFIGNDFLHSYLDQTGRRNAYEISDKKVGNLQYSFGSQNQKEALVREEEFLFLTGEMDYRQGSLNVAGTEGYFCARQGPLYHIATTDMEEALVNAAFVQEAARWKWPYDGEPHIYAQYILLDQVYPFQDPDKLLEIVNYLINKKEPFVISVMPVYNNGNYPAMQHFCEVLRYAQANGGIIVIHSPINQMPEFDPDLVNEYLTTAISIYMEQGVYPMALQVPRNWMFNSDTIEVMSRFRTIFLEDEEDPLIAADEEVYTNEVYQDGHQWISPAITLDASGVSFLKVSSSAVSFDVTDEMESIEAKVQACIESEVPLKSLWDIEHSFWTDEDLMTYRNHIIMVNNKRVENKFEATEYDDDFQYNRNMLQRFSKDLSSENSKLLIAVVVVSTLFIIFILTARRHSRKKFFLKKTKRKRRKKAAKAPEASESTYEELNTEPFCDYEETDIEPSCDYVELDTELSCNNAETDTELSYDYEFEGDELYYDYENENEQFSDSDMEFIEVNPEKEFTVTGVSKNKTRYRDEDDESMDE